MPRPVALHSFGVQGFPKACDDTATSEESMTPKHSTFLIASGVALAAFVGPVGLTPAFADPLPYGPDTCISGYVWREAAPGDNVCVTPAVRDATAAQNANAVANRDPNGAYGSNSCKQGFVWREAFDGDVVCVTPDIRAATKADNAAAASRKASNGPAPAPQQAPAPSAGTHTVRFEITGSGTVYSIDTDPAGSRVAENTNVPFSRTLTVGPDVQLLQVIAVTKTGDQGCRISVDGTVVVDQAPGSSAHCVFNLS